MRRRYFNNKSMNNNIIIYTSLDNLIVTPQTYNFGDNAVITNVINNNIGKIIFVKDLTTIGERAFENCSRLTTVTIGNSVTNIGEYAFAGCSNLTSITIPDSVTNIGERAFVWCSRLTTVTIGNSVTAIGDNAFYGCDSLESVTIPDSVTNIGERAFVWCSSLTSVYCKATTPPSLGGNYVFDHNGSGRKIYVPKESVDAYQSATNWSEYAGSIVGYNF